MPSRWRTFALITLALMVAPAARAQIDHLDVTVTSPQAQGVPFSVTVTAKDASNVTVDSTETIVLEANPFGMVFDGNGDGVYDQGDARKALSGGTMTMSVRLDMSGDFTIHASGGGASGTSGNIHVPAAVFDHFTIDAIAAQTASQPFSITVRALDSANATAEFTGTVDLSVDSGTVTPSVSSNFERGIATFTAAVSAAGTRTITVRTTGGSESGTSNAFSVIAGAVHHFTIAPIGSQTAGTPFDVVITARDEAGNVASSFTGTTALASSGSVTPSLSGAFTGGVRTESVTIAHAGTWSISATRSDGSETGTSNTFAVSAGALHRFTFGPIIRQTSGVPFAVSITARDFHDNVVTAFGGTVSLSIGAASITPSVSGTFTNGTRSETVTIGAAGTHAITATATGAPETGTSASFTVLAGPVASFSFAAIGTQTAGTVFPIAMTARDAHGNTADYNGTVSLTADAGTIAPATSGTFTSGTRTENVTLTSAGVRTITATGATATGSSASFTLTGGLVASFSVAAIGTQTAGTAFSIVMTALDAHGNTASYGGSASLAIDSGTIAPAFSGAFANGVRTESVTVTTAGTRTITVKASGGSESGTSNAFPVIAGALDRFSFAAIGTQTAGSAFPVAITAVDAHGNTADYNGTVSLTADAGTLTPATSGTFTSGTRTENVTLTSAGVRTITATGATATGSSASFTLTGGLVASFSVAAIGTQTAGSAFSIVMTALDAYGNTASYSGTASLGIDSGTIAPTTSGAFTNGVRTESVTVTTAGARTITVKASGGSESGTSNAFPVIAGAVARFSFAAIGVQTAGTAFSIAMTALDAHGNTADYNGTVSLAADAGTLTPATSGTFTSGTRTENVTLTSAGVRTITATGATASGSSASFTLTAGPVASLSFAAIGTQTAGTPFSVVITALDAHGNSASYSGTASLAIDSGTVAPATSGTFANGVRTESVTLTAAGTRTIAATVSGGTATGSGQVTVAPASAEHLVIDPITAQIAGVPFDVGISAYDAFGNLATTFGGSALLTVDGGTITPSATASFAAGRVTQQTSVTLAGSRTISAAATGVAGASSNAFAVLASYPDAERSVMTAAPASVPADGVSQATVNVVVRDAFGNAVPDWRVTLQGVGGGTSTIAAVSPFCPEVPFPQVRSCFAVTTLTGEAAFTVWSTSLGIVTYSAYVGGTLTNWDGPGLLIDATASVNFISGPAVALRLAGGGSATAGVELLLQASAVDPRGFLDENFAGDRAVVISGPRLATVRDKSGKDIPMGSPAMVTFVRGVASVPLTATIAESVVLTASVPSLTQGTLPLTVSPGAVKSLQFDPVPPVVIAGLPFRVGRLRAVDAFGNTVTTYSDSVALTVQGEASGTLDRGTIAASEFSGGVVSAIDLVFSGSTGSATLRAKSNSGVLGASAGFTVGTGSVSSITPDSSCRDYGTDFGVSMQGSGLVAGSSLLWDGHALPTNIAGSSIHAVIPGAELVANPGFVEVTVVDPFGNRLAGSAVFEVTVPLKIMEASAIGGPFCSGSPAQLRGATNLSATFRWTDAKNVVLSDLASPRLPSVNDQTAGTYTLTVSRPLCKADTATVEVALAPAAPSSIAAPDAVPAGSRGHQASVTKVDGALYSWSITGATLVSGQGSSAITWDATASVVTLEVAVATGGTSGCSANLKKQVQVVACPEPVAPTLVSPGNGVSLGSSKVQFTWNAPANASGYEIIVRSAEGALTINRRTVETNIELDLPGGEFNWSVVSFFGVCSRTAISSERTVTVPRGPDCASAEGPWVLSRDDRVLGDSVTFRWTPVPDAVGYLVTISDEWGKSSSDLPPTSSTSLTARLPSGRYRWFVRALFADCIGSPNLSPMFGGILYHYVYVYPCGVAPKPLSGRCRSDSCFFEWWHVPGASDYIVELFNSAQTVFLQQSIPSYGESFSGKIADELVFPREVPTSFRVTSVVPGCASATSTEAPISFYRECRDPGLPQTRLRAPVDGTTIAAVAGATAVTLQWDPASSDKNHVPTIAYLLLSRDGGPWTAQAVDATKSGSLNLWLASGKYRWTVKTHYSVNSSQSFNGLRQCAWQATPRSFTVSGQTGIDCARRMPLITAPAPERTIHGVPITISWTDVDALRYRVTASAFDSADTRLDRTIITTGTSISDFHLSPGDYWITVQPEFAGGTTCASATGSSQRLYVRSPSCVPTTISGPGVVTAGSKFVLTWNPVGSDTARYAVQMSALENFSGYPTPVENLSAVGSSIELTRPPGRWYFRVRAHVGGCAGWLYSRPLLVTSVAPANNWFDGFRFNLDWQLAQVFAAQFNASSTEGVSAATAGPRSLATFSFSSSEPWLVVAPGEFSSDAPVTLSVDSTRLGAGQHTAWLTRSGSDGSTSSSPVVVDIVTPSETVDGEPPGSQSLIVPVVAHVNGVHGEIRSALTITNGGTMTGAWELLYTRSGVDARTQSISSWVNLAPGQSVSYADVVGDLFGDDASSGYLEIRQLSGDAGSAIVTSRAYTAGARGTTGELVPPYGIGDFATDGEALTMIGIEESDAWRTNIGVIELAGTPVTLLLRIFDGGGTPIGEIPIALEGGRHRQLNGILAANGIRVTRGRAEIHVQDGGGLVAAYASVVDNRSGDSTFVKATPGAVEQSHQVLPGIADMTAGGAAWRSDVWLYNAGSEAVEATLTFRAQGPAAGSLPTAKISIAPGEVQELRDVLRMRFGITMSVGALHVSTAAPSMLYAAARTYNDTAAGAYGQGIPAVFLEDAAGVDDPALQITGVSNSPSQRTNVGIAEVSGAEVTVEISVRGTTGVESSRSVVLPAYGFVQIQGLLAPRAQNRRISVQVTGGDGRIVAYGSLLESGSGDPTYIPGQ